MRCGTSSPKARVTVTNSSSLLASTCEGRRAYSSTKERRFPHGSSDIDARRTLPQEPNRPCVSRTSSATSSWKFPSSRPRAHWTPSSSRASSACAPTPTRSTWCHLHNCAHDRERPPKNAEPLSRRLSTPAGDRDDPGQTDHADRDDRCVHHGRLLCPAARARPSCALRNFLEHASAITDRLCWIRSHLATSPVLSGTD